MLDWVINTPLEISAQFECSRVGLFLETGFVGAYSELLQNI